MNRIEYLDWLYYKVGGQRYDFEVCGLWRKEGKTIHTKWKKYSEVLFDKNKKELRKINQRQILPNEVVLDLEEFDRFESLLDYLLQSDIYFIAWHTGSRGYHINLYFDKDLTPNEKNMIITHFGCDLTKKSNRTMIALEYCPHWKTGNKKRIVCNKLIDRDFDEFGCNRFELKPINKKFGEYTVLIEKSKKKLGAI